MKLKIIKNLPKKQSVKEPAATHTKINYLHPFPEGNGRASQEMISQTAKNAARMLLAVERLKLPSNNDDNTKRDKPMTGKPEKQPMIIKRLASLPWS